MEDKIRRSIEGDTDAFMELMDLISGQMYKTAWSILKSDADVADAIQETIISCYEKIGSLRNPGFFRTWVMRILINECYQILRKDRHYAEMTEELIRNIPMDTDGLQQFRFQELLTYADKKYHLILTLYYADEYSITEISELLNMNENTVKTKLSRARDQIRRGLNE